MSIKVTYQLDEVTVEKVKREVNNGAARTMSEFVQQALEDRLTRIWREKIRENVQQATADDAFREDVRDVIEAYAAAGSDGLEDMGAS